MRRLPSIIAATADLEVCSMKTRLIAAAVLIPVLLVVVLVAPPVCTAVLLGVVCAIGSYELLGGTGLVKHIRLICYTAISAFLVPLWCYCGMDPLWAKIQILAFTGILFAEVLISHGKLRFERIGVCLAGGLLIPYLLSSLVRILCGDAGRQLILLPFILAYVADSGAYFVGCAWGKHKLAPIISPNKSIEGLVGGVLSAVLGMLIYCWIIDLAFDWQINYAFAITYGIIGSFAGTFGDLTFSAIKRQTGIKDYGNLIPGHGGILDRFDSVIIVAPLVEILLAVLPFLE